MPVNRDVTGIGALRAEATPCAATSRGCQVGVDMLGMGTALIRGVQKLVARTAAARNRARAPGTGKLLADAIGGVAKAGKRKPDKGGRVAIDLADPVTSGRVMP
ncbi:hypothetical protein AB5I41_15420 [Sphingomonas sp. MMS24-JH45]